MAHPREQRDRHPAHIESLSDLIHPQDHEAFTYNRASVLLNHLMATNPALERQRHFVGNNTTWGITTHNLAQTITPEHITQLLQQQPQIETELPRLFSLLLNAHAFTRSHAPVSAINPQLKFFTHILRKDVEKDPQDQLLFPHTRPFIELLAKQLQIEPEHQSNAKNRLIETLVSRLTDEQAIDFFSIGQSRPVVTETGGKPVTYAATTLTTKTSWFSSFAETLSEIDIKLAPKLATSGYAFILKKILVHNLTASNEIELEPLVVQTFYQSNTQNYYLLPTGQKEAFKELVKSHREELLSYISWLPLAPSLLSALTESNPPEFARSQLQAVLSSIAQSLLESSEVKSPKARQLAQAVVERLLQNQTFWQKLKEAELPIGSNSEVGLLFRTSVRNAAINYLRDRQTAEAQQEPFYNFYNYPNLQSFLKEIGLNHPHSQQLLTLLDPTEKEILSLKIAGYSHLQIEEIIGISRGPIIRMLGWLDSLVDKNPEEWPLPSLVTTLNNLHKERGHIFNQAIKRLRHERWETYADLYFNQGLSDIEIKEMLSISHRASKTLGYRVRNALAEILIAQGHIDPEAIEPTAALARKLESD